MKIKDLKTAAKELNEVLFNEEEKEKGWIEVSNDQEQMEADVWEATKLLEAGEEKDLSKATQLVIKELSKMQDVVEDEEVEEPEEEIEEEELPKKKAEKPAKKEAAEPVKKAKKVVEEIEEEEGAEEPETLESQIENASDIKELKIIMKSNKEFDSVKKALNFEAKIEVLRKKLLAALNGEVKETKKETEKADKPKSEKKEIQQEKSAMYHVRKLTCENPEISSKDLMEKLSNLGFAGTMETSVKIRMTEMKHCIAILRELGKIK